MGIELFRSGGAFGVKFLTSGIEVSLVVNFLSIALFINHGWVPGVPSGWERLRCLGLNLRNWPPWWCLDEWVDFYS